MQGYRLGFVRLLYSIILAQFIVIAILLGGFSNEYLSNLYFRLWIDNNMPLLGLLLTGQADALLVGIAVGGTLLLVRQMKNEARIDPDAIAILSKNSEPLLSHASATRKGEVTSETPEQILVELEKQDF